MKSTALFFSFGHFGRVRLEKDQKRKKKDKMGIASTRGLNTLESDSVIGV